MATKKKTAAHSKRKAATPRHKAATDTGLFKVHGAFKKKGDAERKARKVGGFFVYRAIKAGGDWRYVVLTSDAGVPF